LELSFSNAGLRDICEKREVAVASMGLSAALELEDRLADIDASDTVVDFALLFPDDVIDQSPEKRFLRLKSGHQLVFRSGHVKTPTTSTGATDWGKVSRMRIVAIEVADE